MARVHLVEHLSSMGISEEMQNEICSFLDRYNYDDLWAMLSSRGFSMEFMVMVLMSHPGPYRNSSGQEPKRIILSDPEFQKVYKQEQRKGARIAEGR